MDRALGSCGPHSQTQPNPRVAQVRVGNGKAKQNRHEEVSPFSNQKAAFCSRSPPLSVVTASPGAWPCSPRRLSGLSQDKPGVRCASGATTSSPHVG